MKKNKKKETPIILLLTLLTLTLILISTTNITKAQTQQTPTLSIVLSGTTNNNNFQENTIGSQFTVDIRLDNAQSITAGISGATYGITWNPAILEMVSTADGACWGSKSAFTDVALNNSEFDFAQSIMDTANPLATIEPDNAVVLGQITFQVIGGGQSNIAFDNSGNILFYLSSPTSYLPTNIYPLSDSNPTGFTFTNAVVSCNCGKPTANAGPSQTVTAGTPVTLNGTQSFSADPNANYTWTFNNGTSQTMIGNNKTVTWTFNTIGIYNVTLTVTDSNGISTANITIIVQNTSTPNAVITGITQGETIQLNQTVTLDGSQSSETNNITITQYLWTITNLDSLGSEYAQKSFSGINGTYTFSTGGHYNVTLTVVDPENLTDTTTYNIYVPSSSTGYSSDSTSNIDLAPLDLGIIIIVTILAVGGSTFWLRKK